MNTPGNPDELLSRLCDFQSSYFPLHQQRFQDLVAQGQHPKTRKRSMRPSKGKT